METLAFRSKHDYSGSRVGIEVPIILQADGLSVRLRAKVDTGSEFCIFQRQYAENLGIDVETGVLKEISTTTGRFDAYGHTLMLSCLGWEIEATVYFAARPDFPRNVVGRVGWLQHFRMALIDHDSMLFLSRYDD